ncbi:MAG: enoyl-CoA hydratase [Betaproteobacteria bacterium]|nr:enoyl-CoA hydratase [Betaproteobacteria bacterium]
MPERVGERIQTALEERAGGRVARITLGNPAKLNALDAAAILELTEAMGKLAGDARLRAVVLTGEGDKAFSGGIDVHELGSATQATARAAITRLHRCITAVRECPVPVIARVNGYCIGGALELAAACDLRVAADHARFGMPEVRLGIPSVIEAALLPRLMGAGRARWLLLTGELIDAAEALRWGLVERVVAVQGLDAEVDHALDAILAGGAEAIRVQKRLNRAYEELPFAEAVAASIDAFEQAYATGEPGRMVGDYLRRTRK